MALLRAIAIGLAVLASHPAAAGKMVAVSSSYENFVTYRHDLMVDIAAAHGLDEKTSRVAVATAAAYLFMVPCHGDTRKLVGHDPFGVISSLSVPDQRYPLQGAVYEMIGALLVLEMSHPVQQDGDLCRFALGIASPY